MALKRMVNGREVELSVEEDAAVRAEWAAEDKRRAEVPEPKAPPLERLVAKLRAKNVLSAADLDDLK